MQSRLVEMLFVILGIIIVCIVGFWIWSWATSHAPAATQPTTFGSNTQYPSQVSVGVNSTSTLQSSSQSSQSSQQSLDIGAAYATLFTQLGAEGVTFTQTDASSTGDLGAIYALYAKDVSTSKEVSPGAPDYSVGVMFTDLNGDGVNEALVLEDLPGFCGPEGCPFDIYRKQGGTWTKILSTAAAGDIGLSNVYVGGYQNLLLTVNTGGPYSEVVTYAWNGTTYQAGQVVAVWDGSNFQILQ